MKSVLVTGAAGLIGSRMVKTLLQAGHSVRATARVHNPRVAAELETPVEVLDVLQPEHWTARARERVGGQIDCLIHCATANDILSRNAVRGFDLSVNGTWNMLQLARNLNIRQVIFFSTFQVYGTELAGIVDEQRPPNCETSYGLNHWFGEEVCRMACQSGELSVAVVRPANVYGAPVASSVKRETLVPTCFVKSALETGEIVLRSSGLQYRNFISTVEIARACLHLLDDFPSDFQIYNLCSAFSATIREIAELTAEVHQQTLAQDLQVRVLSTEPQLGESFKARSRLDFLWPTREHSRETMKCEISKLYAQFSHASRAA